MNPILKFFTEKKIDLMYGRLPSESDKPFCFRPHVQGGGELVSVREL